eukprot:gnl/MRDRNA2_/MRDRNA2_100383_c0_seq1.p1 gnl/MRDRNA2_/MRDRNA2_100383_c0~~gnl/MRDRNA2_/MRDRNA2_100383_c0_seq1.p1  ORF type:complete len:469 (+),score=89.62 gnl/MRDRNA2_/MRDRNA2_100383_c0_seq1:130-1536(+)
MMISFFRAAGATLCLSLGLLVGFIVKSHRSFNVQHIVGSSTGGETDQTQSNSWFHPGLLQVDTRGLEHTGISSPAPHGSPAWHQLLDWRKSVNVGNCPDEPITPFCAGSAQAITIVGALEGASTTVPAEMKAKLSPAITAFNNVKSSDVLNPSAKDLLVDSWCMLFEEADWIFNFLFESSAASRNASPQIQNNEAPEAIQVYIKIGSKNDKKDFLPKLVVNVGGTLESITSKLLSIYSILVDEYTPGLEVVVEMFQHIFPRRIYQIEDEVRSTPDDAGGRVPAEINSILEKIIVFLRNKMTQIGAEHDAKMGRKADAQRRKEYDQRRAKELEYVERQKAERAAVAEAAKQAEKDRKKAEIVSAQQAKPTWYKLMWDSGDQGVGMVIVWRENFATTSTWGRVFVSKKNQFAIVDGRMLTSGVANKATKVDSLGDLKIKEIVIPEEAKDGFGGLKEYSVELAEGAGYENQ